MTLEELERIERPHPSLLKLYLIRSVLSGPLIFLTLPILFFRYHTLRYRFDDEGMHMRWGILFRREVNLTYARIQDIHLRSGVIQRWLGLADVLIQTASGSAVPEMTIEGIREYDPLRDLLYTRMRGVRDREKRTGTALPGDRGPAADWAPVLEEVRDALRETRSALESLTSKRNHG
ncbi:MAG TPA: PH domain-containing protein [Verrucomicrobiales bacterium]|nr:PH domain-containing protein [Verrucomicrobiales bacterium]